MTTCVENLEMSGNLTAVSEMSGILLKVREVSGKNSLSVKIGLKTVAFLLPPLTVTLVQA